MQLKDFRQQIELETLAPFYVVTGEEPVLLQEVRRLFVELVPRDAREMNLGQYDLAQTPMKVALEEAMSLPFFGDRKVVLLSNPTFVTATGKLTDAEQQAWLDILAQGTPSTIVVFFLNDAKIDKRKKIGKALLDAAQIIDLPLLDERQARQAIQQTLEKRHFDITKKALDEFVKRTNASYSSMRQELPKLMAYAQATQAIDEVAVTELVAKTLNESVFDMVDAVLRRQTQTALRIYHELLSMGEAPIRINAALLGQMRLLLQVAGLRGSDAEVGQQLKVHPYRVKLARETLRHYQPRDLRDGYLGVLAIDIQLKSTNREPALLFETFVLNFVHAG